ncbi:hypothetical protein E4U43_006245 [Claviceps pusilla]|uniref:Aldehyde dehydrogenase domain-containing protein n=1 Tax=Claviceps pusilla TaxID=123648 RepID=A0A9P7NDY8_9HYPO|nr:hypothetical protein E4U43_006245 [Claviceps pusilla]
MVPQGRAFAERKTRCYKDALQLETQLLSGEPKIRSYQNALHGTFGNPQNKVPQDALTSIHDLSRMGRSGITALDVLSGPVHPLSAGITPPASASNAMANGHMPRMQAVPVVPSARLDNRDIIHGETIPASSGKRLGVIDPGTGRPWISCPDCTGADVDAAVRSSYGAFQHYAKRTPRRRAQSISTWHHMIVAVRDDLAKMLVYETGKPLAEAQGEIDYAISFTRWFVGEAERAPGTSVVSAVPGRRSITIKQPIGVAAAVVPWIFPVAVALRKMAAALAAGCTMVVKPSPETPLTALALSRPLKGGLSRSSWLTSGDMPARPASPPTGEAIHDAFVDKLVRQTAQLNPGHGIASGTTIGPVSTPRGLHKAEHVARDATSKGATMVLGRGVGHGADSASGTGYFMHPTIPTGVTDEMLMSQDEILAPLMGVVGL